MHALLTLLPFRVPCYWRGTAFFPDHIHTCTVPLAPLTTFWPSYSRKTITAHIPRLASPFSTVLTMSLLQKRTSPLFRGLNYRRANANCLRLLPNYSHRLYAAWCLGAEIIPTGIIQQTVTTWEQTRTVLCIEKWASHARQVARGSVWPSQAGTPTTTLGARMPVNIPVATRTVARECPTTIPVPSQE